LGFDARKVKAGARAFDRKGRKGTAAKFAKKFGFGGYGEEQKRELLTAEGAENCREVRKEIRVEVVVAAVEIPTSRAKTAREMGHPAVAGSE
jgi:hypothetical protein